jgi:glycosyltransferase involved in cell wall biosynthesis
MQIESFRKFEPPIVMTLHDMWPFTGGCHHSGDCERFRDQCGACPQLNSIKENDLTRWIWNRKERAWRDVDFTIVSPSRWLANRAQESKLFSEKPIMVIPNGLNVERFRPIDKSTARSLLGLPQDRRLLLFCAYKGPANRYKGFDHIPALLSCLNEIRVAHDTDLIILGEILPGDIASIPTPVHCLGHLHDDVSLALAYSSADVFLMLSSMENLPNTVMEALACGVPCAGFDVGGVGEMVDHQSNGYLVAHGELSALVSGIDLMLNDDELWHRFSAIARRKAVYSYDQSRQAREYITLFQQILSKKRSH